MVATETNAFLTWFQTWYSVPYVLAQIAFWVGLAVAALIIALQYKRFVAYKTGAGKPAAAEKDAAAAPPLEAAKPSPSVSVEEFVD